MAEYINIPHEVCIEEVVCAVCGEMLDYDASIDSCGDLVIAVEPHSCKED